MLTKCLFLALLTQCLALQEQDCTQVDRKTKNLTIQLQVSQSSEFDFSGYIPAVELALHFINSNSCVLPDYHISFTDVVDPQVSRKHFHYISICIQYPPCTWSNKDEQHCWHTEKKVTYLGVVRLLLLCWKAFLENTTPHILLRTLDTTQLWQDWVSSVWVLPSNHLLVIVGQQQHPNISDVWNVDSLEHRKVGGRGVKNSHRQILARQ